MKNIKNIVVAIALSSTMASAFDLESLVGMDIPPLELDRLGVSASVGAWYINWDQTSNASDKFGDQALDVSYDIESALAPVVDFKLSYRGIIGNVAYTNSDSSSAQSSGEDSSIDSFSVGLLILDMIPHLNLDLRYVKANFKGAITAKAYGSSSESVGSFESKLDVFEAIIYPMNRYVGIGYKSYSYELPQDLYVVNNHTNALVTRGLADVSYKGDFIEVVVDNKKLIREVKEYNGLAYSMSAALGRLQASSDGFEKYITNSDALSYDISLGYAYQHDAGERLHYGFEVGYRYNDITTSAKREGDYSMITEFSTNFHGPYASLNLSY